MKLLTHNMLACNIKGVKNGYPFKIEPTKVETTQADFDPEFLRNMWSRMQYPVLREAAIQMGFTDLPEEATEAMLQDDEDFQKAFHYALLEIKLEEGALICPETGRRFPVSKGIPNLLLREDEC